MKPNYAYVAEVLDRSGSMASIADKTRDGHNEFIRAQKALPGECGYLLVRFDHEIETVYDASMKNAPELDALNYQPRGSTALLDAIGDTVKALGQKFEALPEDQRPERVVVVIITDGEENASGRYSRQQVFDMITHQRTAYNWQFLFLGANQDAIKAGHEMGIPIQGSVSYAAANVQSTYGMMTNKVGRLRSQPRGASAQSLTASMAFTEAERKELEEEKK